MMQIEGKKIYREKVKSAGIRESTNQRLDEYIMSHDPHPVKTHVVSVAVEEWLNGQEAKEARNGG